MRLVRWLLAVVAAVGFFLWALLPESLTMERTIALVAGFVFGVLAVVQLSPLLRRGRGSKRAVRDDELMRCSRLEPNQRLMLLVG
jgi:hypothetical protein